MAKKIEEIKKETKETSESYSIETAVNHRFENFLNNPVFLYQGKDCTEDEWPDSEGKNKLTRTPRD